MQVYLIEKGRGEEYSCSKCNKSIPKGQVHYRNFQFSKPVNRYHLDCVPEGAEIVKITKKAKTISPPVKVTDTVVIDEQTVQTERPEKPAN